MGIENYYMNPPTKKSKKKEKEILIRGVLFGIILTLISVLVFI